MSKRNVLVHVLLAVVWLALLVLQIAEHRSFRRSARDSLCRHARDLSLSFGVVIRSQRRFGQTVGRDRLEGALQALAESEEVQGIMLFNPVGRPIARAGAEIDPELGRTPPGTALWSGDSLTLLELAEFGPDPASKAPNRENRRTLVVQGRNPPVGTPPPPGPPPSGDGADGPQPPPEDEHGDKPSTLPAGPDGDEAAGTEHRKPSRYGRRPGPEWTPEMRERFRKWREADLKGQRPPYPPWMSEEEYEAMFREQGFHMMALRLDAKGVHAAIRGDLRQRVFLTVIGLVAVAGLALLYRQMTRSSQLGLQLVRAEAMNNHLREMNLSAAGLAHETRNPLNVVRGLAQMLAGEPRDPAVVRQTSERIVGEVDRVSNRLNEFIAYSKPREPVLGPVDLRALSDELGQALVSDCEELRADWRNELPDVKVLADEGMLRQVLFNILINSLQAIPEEGVIRLSCTPGEQSGELTIRVADSGPGVPEEIRSDVFRPYVSGRDKGTGLGLAVVRQIALAHHWQIDCGVSDDLGGAEFSLANVRIAEGS